MRDAAAVRIRRMSDADLECVLKIAEGLREAPQWTAAAYLAAMDAENVPPRVALVAECDAERDLELCESTEKQTAETKVPAYPPAKFRVVGFAVAAVIAGEAELETIAVSDSEQRRGVGGHLLRALVEEVRTQHAKSLHLEVRASNLAALQFYHAQGFEETGRRRRYYADPEEDAVLMRLSMT
jgi:ribosomal-protein-alanine acetyltransferase